MEVVGGGGTGRTEEADDTEGIDRAIRTGVVGVAEGSIWGCGGGGGFLASRRMIFCALLLT